MWKILKLIISILVFIKNRFINFAKSKRTYGCDYSKICQELDSRLFSAKSKQSRNSFKKNCSKSSFPPKCAPKNSSSCCKLTNNSKSTKKFKNDNSCINAIGSNNNYNIQNYDHSLFINTAGMGDGKSLYNQKFMHRLKILSVFAKHYHKIFTVVGGYPVVKESLRRRNWVEKLSPEEEHVLLRRLQQSIQISQSDYESLYLTQLLNHVSVDFAWLPKKSVRVARSPDGICNRIHRHSSVDYTTKEGLTRIVHHLHRMDLIRDMSVYFPRSYLMSEGDHRLMFLNDFHLSICASFINFLCTRTSFHDMFSQYAKIPSECIDFALRELKFATDNNSFVGSGISDLQSLEASQDIYRHFQEIIKNKKKMCLCDTVSCLDEYRRSLLQTYENFVQKFPSLKYDGFRNIWILKPVDKHRGTGIVVMNNERAILEHVEEHPEYTYIVQKYIENPFLIYDTKFDIRQFFLIKFDGKQLHIWMYRLCYFKFSSQEFTMDDFHESIHLTNHSVQKNYKNSDSRCDKLPEINMWHLSDFLEYLASRNIDPKIWHSKIYPDMIKTLLLIIYASLGDTKFQKDSFELYGADFMITEDLNPALIEINGTPDVSGSTVVSKLVCHSVQEDVIKVVLDHDKDKSAPTGAFEHIIAIEIFDRQKTSEESAGHKMIKPLVKKSKKLKRNLKIGIPLVTKEARLMIQHRFVQATALATESSSLHVLDKSSSKRSGLRKGKNRSNSSTIQKYLKMSKNQFMINSACTCEPRNMIKLYTNRRFANSHMEYLQAKKRTALNDQNSMVLSRALHSTSGSVRYATSRDVTPIISANRDYLLGKLSNYYSQCVGNLLKQQQQTGSISMRAKKGVR